MISVNECVGENMLNQKKLGLVLNYIAQAVHIISGLIYTPIMLRILGQSEYGLYQLVASVVSYLSLFSLGFNSSYVRFYARYKSKNDINGEAALNGLFLLLFSVMAILCIGCGLFMVENINHIFGNGLSENEYEIAKVLLIIMVFSMAISFPSSVLDCQITAHEKFIFLNAIDFLQKILNPFIALPCLLLGYGSVGIVTVSFCLTLMKFIISLFYTRNKLHVRYDFKNLDITIFREVSAFTFFIFINQIVDQINWNLDKFLLGRICGSISVGIYGVASTIYNMYTNLANSIKTVFVPQVNFVVAKQDSDKEVTELFIKVGRIQMLLILLVFSGFLFFGKVFIELWAGNGYEESYYVTILLMAPMIVPLSQCLGVEIQRAKNLHQMRTIVYSCMAILNLVISIPLIKALGAIGAAFGTAIVVIIGNCIFMNIYYQKKIGINIVLYWRSMSRFFIGFLIISFIGVLINILRIKISWISFFVEIFIYSILYLFVFWFVVMNNYEKNIIKKIINKIIHNPKK